VTSLTVQASLEVTQLLEKLFKDWAAWDQNRSYYLHTLLPELKAHPDRGTTQEKATLRELKRVATAEEWDQLEAIGEDLTGQQNKIREISQILDRFFDQNDFHAAEMYISANGGNSVQRLYETKKHNAIGRIWRAVTTALDQFEFEKAELKLTPIKPYLSDTEIADYQSYVKKQQQVLIDKTIVEIREACAKYNYNLAQSLYSRIGHSYPLDAFNALIGEAKHRQATEERARFVTTTVQSIQQLLEQYDFVRADEKYAQVKEEYPQETYLKLVQTYKKKQARENFLLSLQDKLEAGDYPAADRLFRSSDFIGYEEYLRIKSPYIQKFVQNHYSKSINIEKAEALASTSPNLLLSARAGSGKTTVLACKTSMLIECEQVHPDHILVMAFNRSAANEIRNRIRRDYKQPGFDNARTFHSLAHQLVQPTEDLLYDETDDVITRKMSLFVQQLLKEQIRNPVFIEKMYAFFRKEMREIERIGFFLDEEAYFDFRRNLLQVTLNGERVKSVGEKIVADYLFEHDISYGYEKVWLWGSQIYRPDFSIYEQQKDYAIEFWGIDENDPGKQVPPEWSQTWDEYYAEMQAKRAFWNEKSVVLIETSIQDLRNGREAFEGILKSKLTKAGIDKPKLTLTELLHKIRDKDYTITRLSELFTQFIQRAKKQALKAQDVQKLLQTYQPKDDREEVFLDLACRVYIEYEQALTRQRKIDFDDLMMRATEKVHETRGECAISLGNPKSRSIRMNDLRWILIDEYQDFSELFYRLITAIQKYNPQVQLFCVGDDWQAINGFAGSDLQFFDKFREWVKDGQVAHLLTNFRSQAAIVRAGNALMQGCGRPGEHLPQNSGGDVQIGYMDDIWIELRNNDASVIQKTDDERFLITEAATNGNDKKYNRIVASKYLKKCYQIITSPENQGKSVAILSRTNWIDGVRLNEFKNRLIASLTPTDLKAMEDPKNKIHVQTAHKYKGLEADLVIILGACNGAFPLLHPDNALFEIFGKTLMDAFEEERRLFYVALTRAKTSLYILTEKGRESVFLKRIPGYQPNQSSNGWPARSSQYASPLFGSDEEEIPF
jgi:DNA helicase-4